MVVPKEVVIGMLGIMVFVAASKEVLSIIVGNGCIAKFLSMSFVFHSFTKTFHVPYLYLFSTSCKPHHLHHHQIC